MLRFVVRRLLLLIPILIGLSILVFLWIRALPGSPATALLGERATAEQIEAINEQYGLNDPIWRAVLALPAAARVVRLRRLADHSGGPSSTSSSERFPATIELAIAAMLFSILVGIPLGFLAAKRYGSFLDHFSLFASLLGISIPIFVLAIILKYIFAVRLGLVTDRRPDQRPDRPRAPDQLLRPRRDPRAATGRRSGTRSST